jgi:hypothetical protein
MSAPAFPIKTAAVDALLRVMAAAGWTLDWVDIDLTGDVPVVDIRAKRNDGLWVRATVDCAGRPSIERFKRDVSLKTTSGTRIPLAPIVSDYFLGRDRYMGGRSMMRGLCSYLADNAATGKVPLGDMRAAWGALMQSPVRTTITISQQEKS